jgi:uncharacterized SAM-binding protein YcdF (DUF218 family)
MRRAEHGGIFFRLLLLLLLAMLGTAVYLARHPLLRMAGEWLEVQDPPQKADAILVLGDDNYAGDRADEAARLFRDGMAPQVVASGRMLRPYAGIAELIERDLEARGVPAAAIVRFPQRATNTREEAQALRLLAGERGWKRVLVVTSNYHTRRARYIFRKLFEPQIAVLAEPARDSDYHPDRWWESRQGRKLFFLESVGYLNTVWEFWIGEETTPTPAGNSSAPAAGAGAP